MTHVHLILQKLAKLSFACTSKQVLWYDPGIPKTDLISFNFNNSSLTPIPAIHNLT